MNRLGLLAVVLTLLGAACSSNSYTQQEVDAIVAEAVDEAVALALATTTSKAAVTTAAPEVTTTATSVASTTTTVPLVTATEAGGETGESEAHESVVGNEAPPLAHGDDGSLSVVANSFEVSLFGSTRVFVVARNNTDEQIKGVEIALTVRDSSGTLVASGDTNDMYPYRVDPGGIIFGMAFLIDTELPVDAQFEFQGTASDLDERHDRNIDLLIPEHGVPGDKVVGIVENPSDTAVEFAEAGVMCFLEDGTVSWFGESYAEADVVEPGQTSPVSIGTSDNACPIYLMAATGREQG